MRMTEFGQSTCLEYGVAPKDEKTGMLVIMIFNASV